MKTSIIGGKTLYTATCENQYAAPHSAIMIGPVSEDKTEARGRARQEGWLIVGKCEYCPECALRHSRLAHLPMDTFQNAVVVRGQIEDIARDLSWALNTHDMDALVDLLDELRTQLPLATDRAAVAL